MGYSSQVSGGPTNSNNYNGWWPIAYLDDNDDLVYIHDINDWVKIIRFDANGQQIRE